MAELQVKAVARAVLVGNEEGGGFPEFPPGYGAFS